MTYAAGTINNVAPGKALMDAIRPHLGTGGWAHVDTHAVGTVTSDVYKSAAASNKSGLDMFAILRRASDTSPVTAVIAEGYDAVTHKASRWMNGGGKHVTPGAGGIYDVADFLATDLQSNLPVYVTDTGFSYWLSASPNRILLSTKTSSESGWYIGTYDDVLAPNVQPVRMVMAGIPQAGQSWYIPGQGQTYLSGGFTREPFSMVGAIPVASSGNFTAYINPNLGYWGPTTGPNALYGNPYTATPIPIGTGRSEAGYHGAVRGLLTDVVMCQVTSGIGDTLSFGAKTFTRFGGISAGQGIWADQGV